MTIVQGKVLPRVTYFLTRLGLSSMIVLLAMVGQARAANLQVWQGQYTSSQLKRVVSVRLTLDASPAELRFEPMGCSVGLKPVSQDSISEYSVIRYKEDELSGPYCSIWVGGTLHIQTLVDGREWRATLVKGNSTVGFHLFPAP